MDNTYRPGPRYLAGDPYHALAAIAIANITERGDRRQRAVRNTPTDPRSSGSIPREYLAIDHSASKQSFATFTAPLPQRVRRARRAAPGSPRPPVAAITPTERNPPCNS